MLNKLASSAARGCAGSEILVNGLSAVTDVGGVVEVLLQFRDGALQVRCESYRTKHESFMHESFTFSLSRHGMVRQPFVALHT